MSTSSQFMGGLKPMQRGVITIPGGATSATATISAVDTTKSSLNKLGSTHDFSTNLNDANVRIVLTNFTTITATRGSTGGNPQVSWELEERY